MDPAVDGPTAGLAADVDGGEVGDQTHPVGAAGSAPGVRAHRGRRLVDDRVGDHHAVRVRRGLEDLRVARRLAGGGGAEQHGRHPGGDRQSGRTSAHPHSGRSRSGPSPLTMDARPGVRGSRHGGTRP
ncbi:hypothetical protein ACR8AL_07605 [Clavibacter sepedonicus]|uniref:hypothetical protein n=1 Tax=Clavibacter sepedonicus TaxID=31964 RepID=UPI00059D8939|nr:hypothetical protein [Clavibacter sepedonicus]UUK64225.1 hypothetical protein LRE50_07845 [Clavibacter sepedonicus]